MIICEQDITLVVNPGGSTPGPCGLNDFSGLVWGAVNQNNLGNGTSALSAAGASFSGLVQAGPGGGGNNRGYADVTGQLFYTTPLGGDVCQCRLTLLQTFDADTFSYVTIGNVFPWQNLLSVNAIPNGVSQHNFVVPNTFGALGTIVVVVVLEVQSNGADPFTQFGLDGTIIRL